MSCCYELEIQAFVCLEQSAQILNCECFAAFGFRIAHYEAVAFCKPKLRILVFTSLTRVLCADPDDCEKPCKHTTGELLSRLSIDLLGYC